MTATNHPGQNLRPPDILDHLRAVELVSVVGIDAQQRYLGRDRKRTLTETVAAWEIYAPRYIPLPHSS